ncbi:MAG: DUF4363 family protein [Oscillospiraceae bacterium]|jgi:hypothetical protein|nr:DUF4363 family protein [Oscillospiraceae bacterium]
MKKSIMWKEIVVAAIFVGLVTFSLINIYYIKSTVSEILTHIDASITAAERGDWNIASRESERACELWESCDDRTHIVLRHTAIENAEIALNAHLGFMRARNLYEGYGSARTAQAMLDGILELERVRWGSVF